MMSWMPIFQHLPGSRKRIPLQLVEAENRRECQSNLNNLNKNQRMQHLKNVIGLFFFFLVLGSITPEGRAQGPQGRNFGFGLVIGEPLGATVKYWTSSDNAFVG